MTKKYITISMALLLLLTILAGCSNKSTVDNNISVEKLNELIAIAETAANSRSNGISQTDLDNLKDSFTSEAIYTKFVDYNTYKFNSNEGFISLEEEIAYGIEKANMYAPEEGETNLDEESINDIQREIDKNLKDAETQAWLDKTYGNYNIQSSEQDDNMEPTDTETTVESNSNESEQTAHTSQEYIAEIDLDERIVEKDGIRGIYHKELYFIDGIATVKIGAEYVELHQEDYMETEEEAKNNPSYKFEVISYGGYDNGLVKVTLRTIEESRDFIESYFDIYTMNVYMYITNGKISTYEQRMMKA